MLTAAFALCLAYPSHAGTDRHGIFQHAALWTIIHEPDVVYTCSLLWINKNKSKCQRVKENSWLRIPTNSHTLQPLKENAFYRVTFFALFVAGVPLDRRIWGKESKQYQRANHHMLINSLVTSKSWGMDEILNDSVVDNLKIPVFKFFDYLNQTVFLMNVLFF